MIKDRESRLPAPVDRERAREHALLALRRDWAAGMQKDEPWRGGELDPDPIVLHDLNGWPLFHEFLLRRGERVVGSVKTAASQVLGAPVLTVEEGPLGWDPDRALREAMERARGLVPDAEIVGRELVCYSFPKIGVRLDLADREAGEDRRRSLIFDAADFSLVRRFGADELEGQAAYSFYQEVALPRAERNLRRFEAEDRELEEVRRRDGDLLTAALAEVDLARVRRALAPELRFEFLPLYSSRVLKYGPRCNPHDCFMLYAQQTDIYCAVATGQMILDFYRWPYTQDEIAAAMGTGPGGTGNAGQEAGYESLTRKCMEATYDTSAQWAEAKAEIDANRPVKSGVPNHARACAGWKRQNFSLTGTEPKRWLRIYDPWPWNEDLCQGGKVVWEEWDSIEHTNFIYVRHRSSACS